jgi:hypothetical protein
MPVCAVNWVEPSASGARAVLSEYRTYMLQELCVRTEDCCVGHEGVRRSIVARNLRGLVLTVRLRILKVRCFKFFGD